MTPTPLNIYNTIAVFQMDLRPFSVSATVTEVTAMFGRCSTDEVQIVTTAVQHLNVDGPSTAVCSPAETDPLGDFAVLHRGVGTL